MTMAAGTTARSACVERRGFTISSALVQASKGCDQSSEWIWVSVSVIAWSGASSFSRSWLQDLNAFRLVLPDGVEDALAVQSLIGVRPKIVALGLDEVSWQRRLAQGV